MANHFFAFQQSSALSKSDKNIQKHVSMPRSTGQRAAFPDPQQKYSPEDESARRQLQYLQAAIEHNPYFMLIIDTQYRCVAINEKARQESQRMLGSIIQPGMNLKGNPRKDYPELISIAQHWQTALKGESITIEASLTGIQHTPTFYSISFYPIRNEDGQIIGAVQSSNDITAEKQALARQTELQQALRLSNSKLRGIVHGSNYAIAAANLDLELIELNERAHALLSQISQKFVQLGDSLTDLLADNPLGALWQRASRGQEFTRLQKIVDQQGQIVDYEISFSSIRDENGQLIGTSMLARDVSKERRIEQELKDIKEFKFLAENVAQLIWITRADGEPEYYNESFYHYTGLKFDHLKENQWQALIHPDDLSEALQIWERALRNKEACESEYRLRRAIDQHYRWHLVKSIPMKDEGGNVTHWVGSATDIHERKLQSEQIAEKNLQIERINKYLDNFVHVTAHDLRMPVARLQLLVDAFQELPGNEREKLLPKISRSVQHLDATLRGLIQVIELQDKKEEVGNVSLRKVIDDVLIRYQDTIQKTDAQIMVYDEDQCSITYVKSYLYTIVSNLISNALKYRHPDRPLRLEIHIKRQQEFCLLTIKDNGIGINLEQYKKHLFQPFQKISNQVEGQGLGLYVIHTMLEKNGGYAEVESQPDRGAAFKIYLKEYIA